MYIPAKPAPTTTTSYASGLLLFDAACKADIRTPTGIFCCCRPAFYPSRESARDKTARPDRIFFGNECAKTTPLRQAFRRLRARRREGNRLGLPAADGLASPQAFCQSKQGRAASKVPRGGNTHMT